MFPNACTIKIRHPPEVHKLGLHFGPLYKLGLNKHHNYRNHEQVVKMKQHVRRCSTFSWLYFSSLSTDLRQCPVLISGRFSNRMLILVSLLSQNLNYRQLLLLKHWKCPTTTSAAKKYKDVCHSLNLIVRVALPRRHQLRFYHLQLPWFVQRELPDFGVHS
jgi:hypothetical protein